MRVGLVIYGGIDHPSGGFLYDRMLVAALRKAGDTVDIISLPWESFGKCVGHNFAGNIRGRLSGWRGDLLLQDELVHPSLFLLNRSLRQGGASIVSIVHHLRTSEKAPGPDRLITRAVERAYLRGVDAFIFNAEISRAEVRRLSGVDRPGIVAPPGGDRLGCAATSAEVHARSASVTPLRVLFIGSIIPRKGLLTLLQALARTATAQWSLTVVGSRAVDPSYVAAVDRFVEEHDLRGCVRMTDHLADRELAEELRRHHLLAVPSTYEGFGIVYLEAMAFGVVPVGTSAGGAAEIIQDGRSGFLVAPGDAPSLTAVIERLGADRRLLDSCAQEALRRFGEFPGWQRRMAGVCEWLHTVPGKWRK